MDDERFKPKAVRDVGGIEFTYDEDTREYQCPHCEYQGDRDNLNRHAERWHPEHYRPRKSKRGPKAARKVGGERHREVVSQSNRASARAEGSAAQPAEQQATPEETAREGAEESMEGLAPIGSPSFDIDYSAPPSPGRSTTAQLMRGGPLYSALAAPVVRSRVFARLAARTRQPLEPQAVPTEVSDEAPAPPPMTSDEVAATKDMFMAALEGEEDVPASIAELVKALTFDAADDDAPPLVMRGGLNDGYDSDEDGPDDLEEHVADFLAAHGAAAQEDDAEVPEDAERERGWADERLDAPLYADCKYTVRQFAYALHREKQLGTMHDDCCNRLCKLFSKVLPEGNDAPRSYWSLKQANGVPAAVQFERHMCPTPKCSYVFQQRDRDHDNANRDEVCPCCHHGRRYKDRAGPAEPSKRMWFLGVEDAMRKLAANPKLAPHIRHQKHRTTDDPESLWSSEQFKNLDADTAGALTDHLREEQERAAEREADARQRGAPAVQQGEAAADQAHPLAAPEQQKLRTVLFSVGGDGVDLVNWGNRTATVLGLKLEDLPPDLVQTGDAVAPLIIVEGPQEPANMQHINRLVVDAFLKYVPSTDGTVVDGNAFEIAPGLHVYPLLLTAQGDAPFAAKMACACGHSGKTGCRRCCILGSKTAPAGPDGERGATLGAVAFGGAARPAPARRFTAGTADTQGGWEAPEFIQYGGPDGKFDRQQAERLRITDEMALQLGELAERHTKEEREKFEADVIAIRGRGGDAQAQRTEIKSAYERFCERANKKHLEIGATGLSVFAELPYYRATTFHRVGVAHAFLNGLVKGFWKLVGREEKTKLKVGDDIRLTDAQKASIAANVQKMRGTSSYSSALANILKKKHATMEDRLAWTDTVSLFALHDVPVDSRILDMWGHLRAAVVFFMRHLDNQQQRSNIADAQDHLYQYARLVQQHFGTHALMTFQLHTCMVHVAEQARECGPTAFAGEWWVERLMQVFKRIVKYRSTKYPETVAVNHWLATQSLDRIKQRDADAAKLSEELHAGRRMDDAAHYDDNKSESFVAGRMTPASEDETVVNLLQRAFQGVDAHHGGDERRVTATLCADDLAEYDTPEGSLARALRVQLKTTDRASCKNGRFLVRTKRRGLTKVDHYAYVPYVTESDAQSQQARELLSQGVEPPCPSSCSTVLEVQALVQWTQMHERQADGAVKKLDKPKVYRLAVGEMSTLQPVSKPSCPHLYETGFCNGSLGRRKRYPSLLRKTPARSHMYAIWLSDVETVLVSAGDAGAGPRYFVPPLKSSRLG